MRVLLQHAFLFLHPQSTGRFYFKNHDTKKTTWVDPRTAAVRKLVRNAPGACCCQRKAPLRRRATLTLCCPPSVAFCQHAGETEGDELPYGWDEAETPDGEAYYIDHNTEVRVQWAVDRRLH